MQLQIADNQARTAEVMIFKKLWGMATEDEVKPKKLYKEEGGKLVFNEAGSPEYNPSVEPNDAVIINWPKLEEIRKKAGYINPTKAIWTRYAILGER